VQAGLADREVLLSAIDDLHLRGVVVDPDGRPRRAQVMLVGVEGSTFLSQSTDARGGFSLGPLAPGRYSVWASDVLGQGLAADSERTTVEAGTSDLVLALRAGGAISGRVLDPTSGEGVAATVILSPLARGPGAVGTTIGGSEENGAFRFEGLLPGAYSLCASTSAGQGAVLGGVRVEAGARLDTVVLSLQPGARLRVRYEGQAAYGQFHVVQDGAVVAADGVQRGTCATWVVPAGVLEVVCEEWPDEGSQLPARRRRALTLAAGELGELVFGDDDQQR
jgi:hypothetical protein